MSGLDRRDTLGVAEEAAGWLAALKDDDTASRRGFVKWLRSSPRHVEEFLLVTASDQALGNLDPRRTLDVDQMIGQLDSNVVSLEEKNDAPTARRRRPTRARQIRWTAGLAATGVGIALTAAWLLGYSGGRETYSTVVGEQRAVQLADGSLIHINARSKLTVHLTGERRDVQLLEGEALFKVARDPSRPFRVETDRVVVRALGTEFNVDRRSDDTRIAVLEGAVEVTPIRAAGAARLLAGEEARIASSGAVARSKGKTADAVAWRERLLVFSDSPLEEIATEFNRYNRRQELLIEGDDLRDERFGGTFNADEPLALIEFLRRTPGLAVVDEGDRLIIRRR